MKSAEAVVNVAVLSTAKLFLLLPFYAFVLIINGALPGFLSPTLGQAVWLTGFAKALADAPTFSIFAYSIGLPEPAAIAFGLPGALTVAAAIKTGLVSPDAYTLACAIWLAVAFWGAYALSRHFGASTIYSAMGATVWLTFPVVWQHSGYSMLSIGIALLPAYCYSVLIILKLNFWSSCNFLPFIFFVIISPFMDGYTFVMFASASFAILVFYFTFENTRRLEIFYNSVLIFVGFFVGFILYNSYSTSYDFRADIGFFRAWSLDIAYLIAPTRGNLWLPDILGLSAERPQQTLFGDASVHATTFALLPLCAAVIFLVSSYGDRKAKVIFFAVSVVSLYLALGPSFKMNSLRPVDMQSAMFDPMPAEFALGSTRTEFLWQHVPGLNNMRAVYRWMALALVGFWAVTMLAVSDRRMPKAAGSGVLILLLMFNVPNLGPRLQYYAGNRSAFLAMDYDIGQLSAVFRRGETVAFLPPGNDFLINYLAPRLGIRSFNIGGDKNASFARQHWPKVLQEAANAHTADTFADGVLRVLKGTADVVAVPYIDLLWAAHQWPAPKSRFEQVRPYVEKLRQSGRAEIVETEHYAIVRIREGAAVPSGGEQATATDAPNCGPDGYVHLNLDTPMLFSSPESVCGTGWSDVEHWGRWTDGGRASLHYALDELPNEGALEISVQSYVLGDPPGQRVAVRANSEAQPDWVFTVEAPRKIVRIPVPNGITKVEIEFEFPEARSPQQAGQSADSRQLGIGIVAVCLTHLDSVCLRQ